MKNTEKLDRLCDLDPTCDEGGGHFCRTAPVADEGDGLMWGADVSEFDDEPEQDDEPREDSFRDDVDADANALAGAGYGTDEDYGYYGGEGE